MNNFAGKILCLCGGVGGAKLAYGFSQILPPDQLTIVVNTGDDFEHLGFYISPDIDTVIYNLAGINNLEQGWGIEGETWQFMDHLKKTDPKNSWFLLGDKDLETHKKRILFLESGLSLSETTKKLSEAHGIKHAIVPMSNQSVRTIIKTQEAELPFQHYFVKEQCKPPVTGFYFKGFEGATPAPGFLNALRDPELAAIIICPSNPFVSIDPILSLSGIKEAIKKSNVPVLAVSPIINGQAIKGPTAKMMDELNIPKNSLAIAKHYLNIIHTMIIDEQDISEKKSIEHLGLSCIATKTLMKTKKDKVHLAQKILGLL